MRRNVGLVFLGAVVLPMVAAASASAQGSVLILDDYTPQPTQAVNAKAAFSATAPSSNVQIRLNGRSGRLLHTTPVSSGRIDATFAIPGDVAPGTYLLVATQFNTANQRPASFSPARARIRVGASSAGTAAPPGGGRGILPDSPVGLVALGSVLLALAAGMTFAARRIRTQTRPQLGNR